MIDNMDRPAVGGTYGEGLTKREYACIHLRVPDSGDEQLDEIIRRACPQTIHVKYKWEPPETVVPGATLEQRILACLNPREFINWGEIYTRINVGNNIIDFDQTLLILVKSGQVETRRIDVEGSRAGYRLRG